MKSTNYLKTFSFNWFFVFFSIFSATLVLAGSMTLFRRVFCPFQVNQGEAINVEFARTLARGEPLYHDPATGPYLYAAYPPLFPLLQTFLMKILDGPWLPGRLLALAGYWGCALALGYWGWRRWSKPAAFSLFFLFLLSPTWASWGTMVRADSLMIFLEFTAFLILLKVEEAPKKSQTRGKTLSLLGAGILTAVALMLKQNAALLVVAYGFYCVIEKKGRDFLTFLTAVSLPVAALSIFLQWKTDGWFLKYVVLWAPLGFQPELLGHYLVHGFLPECGWLLVGVLAAWRSPSSSLFGKCQVACTFFWVFGLGREAGAENYYLEFLLFGIFFIGQAWALKNNSAFRNNPSRLQILFPVVILLGLFSLNWRPWPSVPAPLEQQMKTEAAEIYRSPGEHLALDLDLPLMAGKRIWVQPMEYTLMVRKGFWNPEPLLRYIREKKYSTIELYDMPQQYLLPQEVVEEVLKSYHISIRKYGRLWLTPNKT